MPTCSLVVLSINAWVKGRQQMNTDIFAVVNYICNIQDEIKYCMFRGRWIYFSSFFNFYFNDRSFLMGSSIRLRKVFTLQTPLSTSPGAFEAKFRACFRQDGHIC